MRIKDIINPDSKEGLELQCVFMVGVITQKNKKANDLLGKVGEEAWGG